VLYKVFFVNKLLFANYCLFVFELTPPKILILTVRKEKKEGKTKTNKQKKKNFGLNIGLLS
jgi:hypothetical protein